MWQCQCQCQLQCETDILLFIKMTVYNLLLAHLVHRAWLARSQFRLILRGSLYKFIEWK